MWTYQNVIALIAVCEAVDHVAQTTPLHQGVFTHLNLIFMRNLILCSLLRSCFQHKTFRTRCIFGVPLQNLSAFLRHPPRHGKPHDDIPKSQIWLESYYFRDSIEMFKYYIPVYYVILSQRESEARCPSEVVGARLHELGDARRPAVGDGLAPYPVGTFQQSSWIIKSQGLIQIFDLSDLNDSGQKVRPLQLFLQGMTKIKGQWP